MSYKTTHHYSFNLLEARDALVASLRKGGQPVPEDSNLVQLLVLGNDQFLLHWETRAEPKPAWLSKEKPDTASS